MTRLVAVTGGLGALGSVLAGRLAAEGYAVAAIDLQGRGAVPPGVDVLDGVDLCDPECTAKAFNRLGDLHGLVNAAGGFAWETLSEGALDTWDRMYAVNLRTAVNACRAALPKMGRGAAIVNIGALASERAGAGMGAYAASKSGVMRLTQSLAAELRSKGIRVNAVLPSIIDTLANRRDMPDADPGEWVSPDQLADVILFLLSDRASAVTGAGIAVEGGVTG